MMKKIIYIAVLFSFLLSGCSTFRALFDESPEQAKAKKARTERKKKASEEKGGDDPVFGFGFGLGMKPKDPDGSLKSSLLTPEEQALMGREESATFGRSVDAEEINEIRKRNRKRNTESSDFVYGSGVKDWL